jgi:hypothetical protein
MLSCTDDCMCTRVRTHTYVAPAQQQCQQANESSTGAPSELQSPSQEYEQNSNQAAATGVAPQHRCTGCSQCMHAACTPNATPNTPSHSSDMHKRLACRTGQALMLLPHTPAKHTPLNTRARGPCRRIKISVGMQAQVQCRFCLLSSII